MTLSLSPDVPTPDGIAHARDPALAAPRHATAQANAAFLRKPDLFVIGAMKSGTTFLARLLGTHPAIFISRPEEPSYFVPQEALRQLWPYMWDQGFWRSEEKYLRLFEPGRDAAVLGEASTNYTKAPLVSGIAERIRDFNPDAKCIYIMRDPIERTISHYWHRVRYNAEHRTMLTAIRQDPRFCHVSHYAMQLAPFFAAFGRDRVLTLTYEDLTRRTEATIRALYGWLGVDPTIALPPDFTRPENATPEVVMRPTFSGVVHRLRHSRPMRSVTPHVPRVLRNAAKRLATERVRPGEADNAEVVAFLRPVQQRQTEELVALLGRDFPEWTTLHGGPAS